MFIDGKIHEWCTRARGSHPALNRVAAFCAHQMIFIEAVAVILLCFFLSGSAWLMFVWRGFSVTAIAWAFCMVIELIIGRKRPFQSFHDRTLGKYWTPNPSFPSAHATMAFAMAMFIFIVFGFPVASVFFAAAFLISISRVYVGVHYFSDVLIGALLGSAVGWIIL